MAAAARVVVAIHSDDAGGPAEKGSSTGSAAPAGEADEATRSLPRIAGYTLHRLLGRGGGGAVYLATRDGSDRRLALKLLNQRLGEGPAAQRAWRELDVLSQLHLAATPRVIDYGLHDGRLFIATEYVEGLPLDRHCDLGGPPLGNPPLGGAAPGGPSLRDGFPSGSTDAESERGSASEGSGASAPRAHAHPHATSASPAHLPDSSPAHPTTASPPHDAQARTTPLRWTLNLRERAELLARVADAVHALHEHGVIHRDIKPSNVIIDTHGDPVIIDLGLAALIADDVHASLTAEGVPIGSPAFMAPEQARGERSLISTRSDVYGLGAAAYVVLTGHTPHDLSTPSYPVEGGVIAGCSPAMTEGAPSSTGSTSSPRAQNSASSTLPPSSAPDDPDAPDSARSFADLEDRLFRTSDSSPPAHLLTSSPSQSSLPLHAAIHRVATQPARDPRSLAPALPRPLAAVLLKAVAPTPQDRYASAAAVAADLRRWFRGEPVTAQPPTAWTRATRWIARHPIAATAAACAAIAVSMVGSTAAVIWWLNQQPAYMRWDTSEKPRWATLFTATGKPIKTWSGGEEGTVPFARYINWPEELGGGTAVVVSAPLDASDPLSTQVAVYRYPEFDRPLWTSPGTEPIVMPPPTQRPPDAWAATDVVMADLFPGYAGPEIVAVHSCRTSQRCVRVYALEDGQLLFEAWHEGGLTNPLWLPDPRLLVFVGDNHEATVEELGLQGPELGHPQILVALRPTLNSRHKWVHGDHATEQDRALVAWYRCILPPQSWTLFAFWIDPPRNASRARDSFELVFSYPVRRRDGEPLADVRRRVGADGRFAPDAAEYSDNAKRNPPLIRPESIELGELPRPAASRPQ
ncbi:MAG: serine/threonine protein kinase [Phycisphaerales bacterium]